MPFAGRGGSMPFAGRGGAATTNTHAWTGGSMPFAGRGGAATVPHAGWRWLLFGDQRTIPDLNAPADDFMAPH